MSMKANGKAIDYSGSGNAAADKGSNRSHPASHVISANRFNLMMFRDITYGPQEAELRFRLLHFWEARVPVKNTLLGLELLLIDEQGTVIKGFITPGRINKFRPRLRKGALYSLVNFYGSRSNGEFRVAAHNVTVSFAHHSELSVIEDSPVAFPENHFRFYSYEEFEANCDAKGDLYDVVGHMKLVNGQSMIGKPTIEVSEVATSRRMVVHIQPHEGPVMKLYLWDNAAIEFCQKFRAFESPPSVVLVTTVNPKRLGGTLALSSMSSSRVFFDGDVQPTRDYLAWLVSHPDVVNQVNAEVVTKRETATIGEIFAYMKQESAKPAFFECTATIDDVVHDAAWYYIGCGGCKTKATRGATSLMCGKCGKNDITGEAQYLAKLSVYDKSEEAVFVLLGDAGTELTGKPAAELVRNYFEANEDKEAGTHVPVPEALLSTVGQTHHFSVKVSQHNLSGKSRSLTVTKILPLPAPPTEEPLLTADGDGVILEGSEGSATMGAKELGDGTEFGNSKRVKRGD
ncbi:hypothetical protein Bca4012_010899 [Brassica carinata]